VTEPLFTRDFWARTFTQAVHASAGAAVGILGSEGVQTLHSLPWQAVLTAAGFGAVMSVLASLASQATPNTATASFVPQKMVRPRKTTTPRRTVRSKKPV
jgi:r1t holin